LFLLKFKTIEITIFDIILFGVLIYAILLQYYQYQCVWNIILFINIFLYYFAFIICRNAFKEHIELSLQSIIGCLIIINIISYYKIIDCILHNKDFLVYINETFGSSGIYAIFLSFTYVLCYMRILERGRKQERIFFLFTGIANIYLSVILKSRTALLIIFFFSIIPIIQNRLKYLRWKVHLVFSIVFITAIVGTSYMYKKQSSEGRLLIFRTPDLTHIRLSRF
jgi:hypothetical protein